MKVIFLCFFSFSIYAAEVDHYLFMYDNQKDATPVLNKRFNSMLAESIAKQNKNAYVSKKCTRVVAKAGKGFKQGTESKIGRWLRDTYKVDQRPRSINGKGHSYYDESIYFDPKVKDIWPMTILKNLAPIINVGGVYVGGDKIGHMTGVGLSMYTTYLRSRKLGRSEKKAERKAFNFGYLTEITLLGAMGSKVTSFGDLEANYQGYRMFRDLCEKNYVTKNDQGKWHINKKVDLRDYINPYMNEIFNPSVYTKKRRKLVVNHIDQKYCTERYFKKSHLISRQMYYKSIARPSPMQLYLKEKIKRGKLDDHLRNHIVNICYETESPISKSLVDYKSLFQILMARLDGHQD